MYIIYIYITRNLNINNQPCLPEMNRKLIPDPNPSNRLSQPRLQHLRDSCNQKKAELCCWSWQLEWAIEQFKFRSCKCYRNLTWWKSEEQVLDMKCVNMILRYNCNTTTDLAQVLKLTLERPFWMFPENQSAVMMIHFCNCGDDDPFYCRVKKVDHHHRSHKSGSSSPQFGFYAFGNLFVCAATIDVRGTKIRLWSQRCRVFWMRSRSLFSCARYCAPKRTPTLALQRQHNIQAGRIGGVAAVATIHMVP